MPLFDFQYYTSNSRLLKTTIVLFIVLLYLVFSIEKAHIQSELKTLSKELTKVSKITENTIDQLASDTFLFEELQALETSNSSHLIASLEDKINFSFNSNCALVEERKLISDSKVKIPTIPISKLQTLTLESRLLILDYCLALNELAGLRNDFALIERDLFFTVKIKQPQSLEKNFNDETSFEENSSWLLFTRLAPIKTISSKHYTKRQVGKEVHANISTNILTNNNMLDKIDTYFIFNSLEDMFAGTNVNMLNIDEFEHYADYINSMLSEMRLQPFWVLKQSVFLIICSFVLALMLNKFVANFSSYIKAKRKLFETGFCLITQKGAKAKIILEQSSLFTEKERSLVEIELFDQNYKRVHELANASFCEISVQNKAYRFVVTSVEQTKLSNGQSSALLIQDDKLSDAVIEYEKIYKHDQLTGLPNRTEIEELIVELQDCSRKYLFAIIDLDHFKALNDNFGHQFGDLVLKTYAQFLLSNFKLNKHDKILRLGGEEFLLLIELPEAEQFDVAAESIAKRLNTFNKESISASCGMLYWETELLGFDQIYPKADNLLYKAKESGRRRVNYLSQDGTLKQIIAEPDL